jgi:predicted alpha/beta-hydrolase family hydrolase
MLIMLSSPAHKTMGPPKVRAQHITGVNTVRSVSLTLTNTNALPGAQRGFGR